MRSRKKLWNQAAPQFHGWSYMIMVFAMNMTDIIMFFWCFFSIKMTMNWGLIHPSPPGRCQASMLWPVWLVPPSRRRIYKALRRPGRKNSPESQCVFKGFLCEGLRDWGCHWLSPKSLSYLSYAYTGYPCLVCFWTLEHWNVQGNIDKIN